MQTSIGIAIDAPAELVFRLARHVDATIALADGSVDPSEIDYVNAHASSTRSATSPRPGRLPPRSGTAQRRSR